MALIYDLVGGLGSQVGCTLAIVWLAGGERAACLAWVPAKRNPSQPSKEKSTDGHAVNLYDAKDIQKRVCLCVCVWGDFTSVMKVLPGFITPPPSVVGLMCTFSARAWFAQLDLADVTAFWPIIAESLFIARATNCKVSLKSYTWGGCSKHGRKE